jgi:hypothetical protein
MASLLRRCTEDRAAKCVILIEVKDLGSSLDDRKESEIVYPWTQDDSYGASTEWRKTRR